MKHTHIKIGLIILTLIVVIAVGYYIYAIIMSIASQRMPVVNAPIELKKLEKEIQNETKGGSSVYFNPIPQYEYDDCHINLDLRIAINNDSLINSNSGVFNYLENIKNRVKKEIETEECIDSLIIVYSIKEERDAKGILVQKRHSFPIK